MALLRRLYGPTAGPKAKSDGGLLPSQSEHEGVSAFCTTFWQNRLLFNGLFSRKFATADVDPVITVHYSELPTPQSNDPSDPSLNQPPSTPTPPALESSATPHSRSLPPSLIQRSSSTSESTLVPSKLDIVQVITPNT